MSPRQSSKKTQPNSTRTNASVREQDNHKELFPIVGLGASAGGLDAYTQLLNHLPTYTGMAFVLIQHLNPDQKSWLSEILSKATKMPVIQAENEMVVEPNHVYVIPPSKTIDLLQKSLKQIRFGEDEARNCREQQSD
ncbi:hypothetical protein I8752_17670 [Nostocaceae cyanobacterium CENA369]|uniref:protein-glutamate methylesterase n=1 Tax=Dendronalium phyllosphericum CENA369 TaxID=1725256 RepID=A0A8J7IC65_9NOST|nr:chemotaxis protein CheB [Dendronalium phyllosphericum]MBH8574817.1 hypothetical protein [Dendronalium phyllosphericum CENA369]